MQGFLWVFCCRFFTTSSADVLALCVYHVTASQPAWGWALRMPWPRPQPAPGPLLWLFLLLLFSVLWSRSHWDVRRASDPARLLWTASGPGAERAFCPCGRLSPGEVVAASPARLTGRQVEGRPPSLLSRAEAATLPPGTRTAPQREEGARLRRARVVGRGRASQRSGVQTPVSALAREARAAPRWGRGGAFQQEGRKCPVYQGQLRPMAPAGTPEPTGPPVQAGVGPWSPVELWPHRRHALRCLTSS